MTAATPRVASRVSPCTVTYDVLSRTTSGSARSERERTFEDRGRKLYWTNHGRFRRAGIDGIQHRIKSGCKRVESAIRRKLEARGVDQTGVADQLHRRVELGDTVEIARVPVDAQQVGADCGRNGQTRNRKDNRCRK